MFESEVIRLTLESGKPVTGLKCGSGPIPCLISPPGSFYFGKLSDELKQQFTFYTFDDLWTYEKGKEVDKEAIEAQTFESLVAREAEIVRALKKKFGYPKVGLMGFSVQGLVAIGAASSLGADHVAFVMGSGIASTKLDPEFKAANAYFEKNTKIKHQDPERQNRFKGDQDDFEKIPNKRDLSSESLWVEAVRSIAAKQVYDYNDETVIKKLLEDWRETPDGKILCEPMRQRYFKDVLLHIDPKEVLKNLLNEDIPLLLAYGKRDYTTPPPKKAEREGLEQQHSHFFFRKYDQSVHYPSGEPGSQKKFDMDVREFLDKHEISGIFENAVSQQL